MTAAALLPFGGFGTSEMILVFLVVVLLTGGKNLPALGRSLGESARDLVRSMTGKLDRTRRSDESRLPPPQDRPGDTDQPPDA